MKSACQNKHRRSGQALVMVTMSLFLMLGMLGLAVDLGWAYYRRDAAQTAADAAASAMVKAALYSSPSSQVCGTNNIWCGSPAGTITTCPSTAPSSPTTTFDYGCRLAADNGFLPSGTSRTVTIQANTTSPAPTVPGTTVNYWATVRITELATAFFGSASNTGALTSSAIATAAVTTTAAPAGSGACLYLLGTTGTTLNISNGVQVTTSSCGVFDNSNSASAISVVGGSKLTSTSVKVVGGYSTSNGGCIDTPTGACNSLTPTTGATAVADPFSGLPSPTVSACSGGNYTNWQATPYSLSPGSYCGMIVGNGMSAVLAGGTYIIDGGSFSIAGGSTLTTTGGVMIYLTNGATVSISNNANVTMSAQSSGSYEGVLFYQDRTMTSPGGSSFQGGSTMHLTGSLYFPYGALTFDNGSNAQTEAIVANSITFAGGATLNQATSQSQTGLSIGGTSVASMIQ